MHHECMICLGDFEEGERVGDLPCCHAFHVDPCLKQWLERKNHCPLCHAQNLAVPTDKSPRKNEQDEMLEEGTPNLATGTTSGSSDGDAENGRDDLIGGRIQEDPSNRVLQEECRIDSAG